MEVVGCGRRWGVGGWGGGRDWCGVLAQCSRRREGAVQIFTGEKSETRVAASVLKTRSKNVKRSKES